jgi:hypothetical protein
VKQLVFWGKFFPFLFLLTYFVILWHHGEELASIDYMSSAGHLLHESVYVGDDTTALLLHLKDEGQETGSFYRAVIAFYTAFVKKLLKVHNFRSPLWHIFSFLDPRQSRHITVSLFDDIERAILIPFDKSQVKLEARSLTQTCYRKRCYPVLVT